MNDPNTSALLARIAQLEQIVNEVKARLLAVEDRLTTAEQSLAQRWWQG